MRVGVDIGGTKTEAVAIDDAGLVIDEVRVPTGFGAEAVVASTVAAVTELAERLGTTPSGFGAIGVGVPGAVDPASGRVAHAVNLGLDGLALGDELAARLGVRVRLENDVNVAALGAFHLLGHGPERSMAYLNLGTGLAAGLVLGGRLWRGSRGTAGEIGHIPVDPAGEL
ncbi:MAG: ROK family protein, partial [Leifsonia sp.]|nr:ROK family protein [Leifsonia sp.]